MSAPADVSQNLSLAHNVTGCWIVRLPFPSLLAGVHNLLNFSSPLSVSLLFVFATLTTVLDQHRRLVHCT
jgi:hypothetical protein